MINISMRLNHQSLPGQNLLHRAALKKRHWLLKRARRLLGLVSHMPSGPGVISDELIAAIAATVPPRIGTFLLTSRQSVDEIVAQQRFCRTNTIQICDHLTRGTHRELKDALPGISIVQVIHVTGPESVEEAVAVAPHVDAILLDSGNQKLAVKELGGTGRTHDWTLSRKIRERIGDSPCSWREDSLPENVAQAIQEVGPFGLDVCSGVRTNGKLDAEKLKRFFQRSAQRGPSKITRAECCTCAQCPTDQIVAPQPSITAYEALAAGHQADPKAVHNCDGGRSPLIPCAARLTRCAMKTARGTGVHGPFLRRDDC